MPIRQKKLGLSGACASDVAGQPQRLGSASRRFQSRKLLPNVAQSDSMLTLHLLCILQFLSFICSLFLVINWILGTTLVNKVNYADRTFYHIIAPILTLPLPFMIILDVAKKFPRTYQIFLTASIWSWTFYSVSYMHICGFYGPPSAFDCGGKEMINAFYYMIALPVIALFGMGQQRFYDFVPATAILVMVGTFFIPKRQSEQLPHRIRYVN